jgi:hypothetical protein
MRRARWLAEWKDGAAKPVLYHTISRVVDRRFVFAVFKVTDKDILSDRQINGTTAAHFEYDPFGNTVILSYFK